MKIERWGGEGWVCGEKKEREKTSNKAGNNPSITSSSPCPHTHDLLSECALPV